ncbi:MAG: hypothetical protein KGR16_01335 [Verrucomicrobia bacterium]|nr:hypothetical protein [Verrucomicrobiota bacterium]
MSITTSSPRFTSPINPDLKDLYDKVKENLSELANDPRAGDTHLFNRTAVIIDRVLVSLSSLNNDKKSIQHDRELFKKANTQLQQIKRQRLGTYVSEPETFSFVQRMRNLRNIKTLSTKLPSLTPQRRAQTPASPHPRRAPTPARKAPFLPLFPTAKSMGEISLFS